MGFICRHDTTEAFIVNPISYKRSTEQLINGEELTVNTSSEGDQRLL